MGNQEDDTQERILIIFNFSLFMWKKIFLCCLRPGKKSSPKQSMFSRGGEYGRAKDRRVHVAYVTTLAKIYIYNVLRRFSADLFAAMNASRR